MGKSILSYSGILVLGVLVVLINGLSDQFLSRFYVDLTEENLYSISDGSENILRTLSEPITLRFYFSRTEGTKYPAVKLYGGRVLDLLKEYERKSKGMLKLETYDPLPDTEEEEWAQKYGLSPLTLPGGGSLFFGLVGVSASGKEDVIPIFDFTRQEFLEYDISKLLYSLNQQTKPVVGVISSLDVQGGPTPPPMMMQRQPQGKEQWIFANQLEKFAQVIYLDKDVATISDNVSILLVVHPKNLSEQTRYAIDQFIVKGGKAFIAVDPHCANDQPAPDPSNPLAGMTADRSSNLSQLFEAWGVKFTGKGVVGDINLATKVAAAQGMMPQAFPVWMTLGQSEAGSVNRSDVTTALLDNVLFAWAGGFTFTEVPGLTKEALLETSKDAMVYEENDIRFSGENPEELMKKYRRGSQPYVLAAKLSGKFKSAFKEKPALGDAAKESSAGGHIAEGQKNATVVIVSDVDFMSDQYSASSQNLLGTRLISLLNDNLIFVANAIENLSGSDDLISLRSRGKFARPFTKVQEIEAQAQERWKEEEMILQAKLNAANQRLTQLQSGNGAAQGNTVFNAALLDEIKQFREERLSAQRKLREVRRRLREDKEQLGTTLFAVNTFLVPAVLIVLSIVLYRRKQQRPRSTGSA